MSTADTPQKNTRPGAPSARTLLFIGRTGHFFLIGSIVLFIYMGIKYPDPYDKVWALILSHITAGRVANAALGIKLEFNYVFLVYQSFIQDAILMLYVYPWFVRGFDHLTHWPIIGHKKTVAPYGALGLFLFVIFPLWSTGPLVGVLIGYLIGMSALLTFSVVFTANLIAVGAWIWFYDLLNGYSEGLALSILVIVIVVAVGGTVYSWLSRNRKNKTAQAVDEGVPAEQEEDEELSVKALSDQEDEGPDA
jgi:uncharacterized membrane protein